MSRKDSNKSNVNKKHMDKKSLNIRFFLEMYCSYRKRVLESMNWKLMVEYFRNYEFVFSLSAALIISMMSFVLISNYQSFLDYEYRQKDRYSVMKLQVDDIAVLSKKSYSSNSIDVAMSSLRIVLDNFSRYQSELKQSADDKLNLKVSSISFAELIKMLNDIQRVSFWVVHSIKIDRQAREGLVMAEVSLKLLGKDRK